MPRVLAVSYYSPPYGGPQSFRLTQLVKHLPAYGWHPKVLTACERAYEPTWRTFRDERSFSLHGVPTIRTPALRSEPAAARLQAALRRERASERPYGDSRPQNGTPHATGAGVRAVVRLGSVLASPDRLVTWAPLAIAAGLRSASQADLIYGCGPPFTNHLVATILAELTHKPLAVMVDDPWLGMDHRQWRSAAQKLVQTRQEKWIMAHADAVLTGTHGFRADIERRLGPGVGAKTSVVLWGFDPDDYGPEADPRAAADPGFELLYTGSLRGEQYDLRALLSVLRDWRREPPELAQRFRLRLIGSVDETSREMINEFGLAGVVSIEGFTAHRDLARAAATADALLLVIGDTQPSFESYTSAKLFYYMGLRRPVLALVPPSGEAAALVREKQLGLVASPSDPVAVRRALEHLVAHRDELQAGLKSCAEYTSTRVVARAAEVFAGIVHGG